MTDDPTGLLRLLVDTAHHRHPSDADAARAELGRLLTGPADEVMATIEDYLAALAARADAAHALLERLQALERGEVIRLTAGQVDFLLERVPGIDASEALPWAGVDVLRHTDGRLFIAAAPSEETWP